MVVILVFWRLGAENLNKADWDFKLFTQSFVQMTAY
jgi:hypothetical protein